MSYVSTRGSAPQLGFLEVLMAGLATDGGLYVPAAWPRLGPQELRALGRLPYGELAARIMAPFVGDAFTQDELRAMIADAYAGFDHQAVTPLTQLDQGLWLMELFHGPTLAFKDVALQLLGRLFDAALARSGRRMTIVGATSGDTGSAAIEACRDRDSVDVFILYPHGRTSEVQRRQMTTVPSANVHAIAIEGTFDDCQALVKAMFNDRTFRETHGLSAVNSINWARIMAQIVYYVAAAVALGAPDRPVSFAVPTGNFGNVYAAYAARAMGVPIERLIIGTNSNDILARFFASGAMRTAPVVPTVSPSMDIQVSSNLERLLFDLYDRDGAALTRAMTAFAQGGSLELEARRLRRAVPFEAHRVGEDETLATIGRIHKATGMVIDPHTAVGVAAAHAAGRGRGEPVVALACAHPAKFPDAVERACGVRPPLPPALADLYERPERLTVLPNDLGRVQAFVRSRTRATAARGAA